MTSKPEFSPSLGPHSSASRGQATVPESTGSDATVSDATISCWRLGEQVTGGSLCEIYRAAPRALAQLSAYDYAIKVVNPSVSATQTAAAVERLGREAAACDSIGHHGILPLLDAELDKPPFFVVQPWIDGGTLNRFMAVSSDISLIRCLWILRQITEALAAAHDHQRVYLGLDPTHILLGSGGRILLTGFGRSCVAGHPAQALGSRFQSIQYTAPENFEREALAIPASDVYSLGLLVHRLVGGRLPFRESTVEEVVQNRQQVRPIELIRNQPTTPIALSNLVEEMLDPCPANRPSMRSVLDQLISIEIENLKNPALIQL